MFSIENISGIYKTTISIETLCGGKVNKNEKTNFLIDKFGKLITIFCYRG